MHTALQAILFRVDLFMCWILCMNKNKLQPKGKIWLHNSFFGIAPQHLYDFWKEMFMFIVSSDFFNACHIKLPCK